MPHVLPSKIPEEPQFFVFWVGEMRLLIVEDAKKKLAPPPVYMMTTMAAKGLDMVTHSHPLGIEAAIVIALATNSFLHGANAHELLAQLISTSSRPEIHDRLVTVETWIKSNARPTPREVASKLGNGVSAHTSCPTAIYIALHHRRDTFERMMQFTIDCRGDVDTIGAMAGALWGSSRGASELPPIPLESRDEIVRIGTQLFERYQGTGLS